MRKLVQAGVARLRRLGASGNVRNFYFAMLAGAWLMDLRRSLASMYLASHGDFGERLGRFDFIAQCEWLVLLAIAYRMDLSSVRSRAPERIVLAGFCIYALLLVDPLTHRATSLFCLALAGRLAFVPHLRRYAFCLALAGIQFALTNRIVDALVGWSTLADAWLAHIALQAAGYSSELNGVVLQLRGATHAVEVAAGCDTPSLLLPTLFAYIVLWLSRAPVTRGGIAALAFLVSFIWIENIARLFAVTLSYSDFVFWHSGSQAAVLKMINSALPLLLSELVVMKASGSIEGVEDTLSLQRRAN